MMLGVDFWSVSSLKKKRSDSPKEKNQDKQSLGMLAGTGVPLELPRRQKLSVDLPVLLTWEWKVGRNGQGSG